MATLSIPHAITFSLLLTSALSFSFSPLNLFTRSSILSSRANNSSSNAVLSYPFFVNCWANPGARSEVDWFASYPKNFGSANPDASSTTSSSSNYKWEDGGSTTDPAGNKLVWPEMTDKNASTNAQAGTATDGKLSYMILRDTDSTLYKDGDFNCIVAYRLQQVGGGTTTISAEPASPTGNSTESPAEATTTSANTTPSATAANSNNSTSNKGLSAGAQAGIGVGVGLAGAILLGALGFTYWRRRRRARAPMTGVYDEKKGYPLPGGEGGDAGMVGKAAPGTLRAELHHEPARQELGGEASRVEAPGEEARPNVAYELDGGSSGVR